MRMSFETSGLEVVTRELQNLAANGGAMTTDMLDEGAKILEETWEAEIYARDYIDTGDMFDGVKRTEIKAGTDQKSISVYPQGTGRNGTRNAEKAFLLHYGWVAGFEKQEGGHFVDAIKKNAEPKVHAAMEAVVDMYIK